MTANPGGTDGEQTRVDREPPSFPSVSDSPATAGPSNSATLFNPPPASNDGAQTAPVAATSTDNSKNGRGGRLRWLVAGLATLVVLVLVGGVLVLAAPRAGAPSATAHYVPADTGMYVEVRLDLPGDQHDNLAAFMSHFPGFADQAAFQQKFDETLNTVLARSGSGLDWNTDVKPWFGGQVAVFGNFQAPKVGLTDMSMGDAMASAPDSVIALTVTDKAKLQELIDAHIGGAQVDSTDYQGQQIKTIAQPAGMSVSASYVITDDALLVAPSVDLIKEALDVKAGKKPALGRRQLLPSAAGSTARRSTRHGVCRSGQAARGNANAVRLVAAGSMHAARRPPVASSKLVGEVRAESDHLAFSFRTQIPTGDNAPPAPANKQTKLAQSMPSDTLFYLEARNAGDTVGWLIKNLLTCASAAQPGGAPLPSGLGDMSQIFEQFLGAKPENYFDFVDDAAVGLTYSGDKVSGGLVGTVDDQATATQRVDKLVALVQMLGAFGGGNTGMQITSQDADHNGTKVTTITIVPSEPGATPVTLQVATANGKFYLGMNDFVTAALDQSASDSLATNARYQKALSEAPADNSGIIYVDVADLAKAAEEKMTADEKTQFETNTKPFIDPLSSFSIVGHVDNGTLVNNGFLFVE